MLNVELIQRVQSLYSKGVNSDDTRLSSRHIFSKCKSLRSKFLSQKLKKKQTPSQWDYQTLPCVELISVERHECDCLPPIGCKILKSKYPIPKPLTSYDTEYISSVTTLDGSITYSKTSIKNKKYKSGSKYVKHMPDFYIKNSHLYITCNKSPKIITITGLFEDPEEVANFKSYCNQDCIDCDCIDMLSEDFPLSDDMIDTLITEAANELVILFNQNREDKTNNANSDN